jgi:hypothetical protein
MPVDTPSTEKYTKPRWLRDLVRFLPLKSQFVLSGNVKDLQTQEVQSGVIAAAPLISVLAAELVLSRFWFMSRSVGFEWRRRQQTKQAQCLRVLTWSSLTASLRQDRIC